MANLLVLAALAMLDVIPVAAPRGAVRWAARLSGGSVAGVFLMGAASGLVAAPCGAPAFAAVLTFVATTGSALLGMLYLLVFSLGLTAVLVAVGLFSGTLASLPRAGRWTAWVKRTGGVLMLAMAEYYLVKMGGVL
jgi:thiol:disulfide interchange protein DsbD